jgi:hypothetical protein
MEMNRLNQEKNGQVLQKILIVLLAAALTVIMILLFVQCEEDKGPSQTAVIYQNEEESLNIPESGSIRIVISPVVQVIDKTMQNLGFCNYNKDRLLQCRIRVGEQYVYDSGLLAEGSELIGDFVETEMLKKGENEALAEIYSYTLEEQPVGQTNVKIILNLQ